eukprot:jgi/Mesen1/2243/ME000153S01467
MKTEKDSKLKTRATLVLCTLGLALAATALLANPNIICQQARQLGFSSCKSSACQEEASIAALTSAYGDLADQITAAALAEAGLLSQRLDELSYGIGARITGSAALERAIRWVRDEMRSDGLEEVQLQAVEGIANWTRGRESLELLAPRHMALSMVGLGGSIGGDLTGEVLVVASFEDLAAKAAQAHGKIVLFNEPYVSYEETVVYRSTGAVEAAKVGAVAALVRSVQSFSMGNPHTGVMAYADNVTRIPTAALSLEHADLLQWLSDRNETITVRLKMEAQTHAPVASHNVLGQVSGRKSPHEVVTVGGHIDSWDVGLGAMDDGAGLLVTWEAVRVVAFVDEEQGTDDVNGGITYAKTHSHETHVMAIESDSGAFQPRGFYAWGASPALSTVGHVARALLAGLNATEIDRTEYGGTDVTPLHQMYGTLTMELKTDASKYFWYHHSVADTPDKMDPQEMARCAATVAIMAYTIADIEEQLPREHPLALKEAQALRMAVASQ